MNYKIAIAEDNTFLANALIEKLSFFKEALHFVFRARDGKELVEKLEENREIDLILMDIRMPELGGVETCKIIRSKGNDVTIVALTANAMKGDRERFLAAGMNDYLSKPLMVEELIKVLSRQFSRNDKEDDW